MSNFDFSGLYSHYPEIIASMPTVFSSHKFILKLAQEHQSEYIEALYAYRTSIRIDNPAPFMIVHGLLAKGLRQFPKLVEYIGYTSSTDIFGQPNECSEWRKL